MSLYKYYIYSDEEIAKMVGVYRLIIYKVINERKSERHKGNKYTELL